MKNNTQKLALAGIVAAVYTALTLLLAPLSFGPWQFRAAEALTVLPFFFPSSIFGLTVGCFLSNLMSGYGALDLVFGPLATLLAAALTARCRHKPLAILPPILINAAVIGAVIAYSTAPTAFWAAFWPNVLSVGVSQTGVLVLLGLPMLYLLPRTAVRRFF